MAKEFFTYEYHKANIVEKPRRNNFRDLTDIKVGKLTVLNYSGIIKKINYWWCRCECDDNKYFRVASQSLIKGITRSCGCNYKTNSNGAVMSMEEASTLTTGFTFKDFRGWNKQCVCTCNTCGKTYSFNKAYSARQTLCCNRNTQLGNILQKLDYTQIDNTTINCNKCNSNYPIPDNRGLLRGCPCDTGIDNPVGVYILEDALLGFCKIGKAKVPSDRCKEVITSASRNTQFNFIVKHVYWVSGEASAYYLESVLHREFKDTRTVFDFDGGTEVFEIVSEDILHHVDNNLQGLLSNLQTGNVPEKEVRIPKTYTYTGFEYNNCWYPSKTYFSQYHKIPLGCVEEALTFTSLKWYKIWKPLKAVYKNMVEADNLHGKDWGDGIFGNIHGLARKYGHEDGTIWHRVNKLNLSMKDALDAPTGKIDHYWNINNKWYNKSAVCEMVGLQKATITHRVSRGIPLIYAIIPERFAKCQYKDKIFNLNGDMYWWGDLCQIFNITKPVGWIINKYGDVSTYLTHNELLTPTDYFEEVDLTANM